MMKRVNQTILAEMLNISPRQVRTLTGRGILNKAQDGKYNLLKSVDAYILFKGDRKPFKTDEEIKQHKRAIIRKKYNEVMNSVPNQYDPNDFTLSKHISSNDTNEIFTTANTVNSVVIDSINDLLKGIPEVYHLKILEIMQKQFFDKSLLDDTFKWMEEEVEALSVEDNS